MGGLMGDNTTKKKPKTATESHEMEIKDVGMVDHGPSVYELSKVFKTTGALVAINIGLSALCLCVMLASYGENQGEFQHEWDVLMFISAFAITLIVLITILFVIIARRFGGLTKTIHFLFAVMCTISSIVVAVGAIAAAANVKRSDGERMCRTWTDENGNDRRFCYKIWDGDIAADAAVVGFLTLITLIVQTVFHIRDAKNNSFATSSTN